MDVLGALQNLAEVGVAITGFSGIVAVVGYSSAGSWTTADRDGFRALVVWSLGAAFLAYVPVVLSSLGPHVSMPWRLSNGVSAVFHGYILLGSFRGYRAHPEIRTRYHFSLFSIGSVVLAAEIAAALGPLASVAPSVYLIAVLWFLFIAASCFLHLVDRSFGSSTT